MKLQDIGTPVSSLSGVGPSMGKLLARLDIFTVSDLLSFWPRDWEDQTRHVTLAEWNKAPKVHTIAQVTAHDWFGFGKMRTLRVRITDGTCPASLICFNRPFLEKSLPIGAVISVTGKFDVRYGELQSSAFEASCISRDASLSEYENAAVPNSAVFPIYPLTAGLTQVQLRKVINRALTEYGRGIEDEIPEEIRAKRQFMHKQQAVFAMHRPDTLEEALAAQKTLVYEELFNFQKAILSRAAEHRKTAYEAYKASGGEEHGLSPRQQQLLSRLPFQLTDDQKKVVVEMNADLDLSWKNDFIREQAASDCANGSERTSGQNEVPAADKSNASAQVPVFRMSRLLQGDVGSGKTLVAFLAMLRVIDNGGQCALLAPTEILAKQHAENAAKMLQPLGVNVAFLTGNIQAKSRTSLLKALKAGDIQLVAGTHALFSQSVQYKNLRLAVIDEQHRFGVVQRNAIIDKGRNSLDQQERAKQGLMPASPDILLMSATPIPQTLAHTVYGDLDVSVIKTMPAGRKPIQTHLTREGNEARVYEAVRAELRAGHQAYFVYPLIENADMSKPLKSAEQSFDFLSKQVYPEFSCALIHSKVEEEEQNRILEGFRTGAIQVLIATSVVEVGVDVPNATCMIIEHAERFGLAALHQLRGRVGRGAEQSHCFLIYSENLTELGKARLKVLHESTDGFYIAEEDLKLRGPGDVNGIQQSGYFTLGIADPVKDAALLELARQDVLELQK